jgi:hypothetical protein
MTKKDVPAKEVLEVRERQRAWIGKAGMLNSCKLSREFVTVQANLEQFWWRDSGTVRDLFPSFLQQVNSWERAVVLAAASFGK